MRGDLIFVVWGQAQHERFPTKKAGVEKQRELRAEGIKSILYEIDPSTLEERLPKKLVEFEVESGHRFHRRRLRRELVAA